MKRLAIKIGCATLAMIFMLSFSACTENKSEQPMETTAATTEAATTVPPATEAEKMITETDLTKLHAVNEQGDLFAGMWRITGGTGSQLKSFVYEFDGNGAAFMMVGTTGYCGTYGIKAEDGKDLFVTQLMFGLDGKYTYEFSKDKNTVVLTKIPEKTVSTNPSEPITSTLEKVSDFSPVPDSVENPEIDEAILGAWTDDKGGYLYFGKDGVMYDVQADVTFTFYTYSANNGQISEISYMTEAINETATYSVEDDVLTYNNIEYQRVSADKLP